MDHFQSGLWLISGGVVPGWCRGGAEVVPGLFATPVIIIIYVLLNVSVAHQGTMHVQAFLFRAEFFVATFALSLQWQLCGAAARRDLGNDARLHL